MSSHVPAQGLAALADHVARASPASATIAIVASVIGAAFAGWRAWRLLFEARLIEDTPRSKARSAPQGYVEIQGAARAMNGAPTIAPLTGLPCCWHRFIVEECTTTYRNGRRETRWQTVDRGESTDTFWLEDDTGHVAIDPEGAEMSPKHKDVWTSASSFSGSPAMPDAVATFMRTFFVTRTSDNPHRFTEWRVNSGDPLYALGLLKNVSSYTDTPSVDDDVRALLHEWKQDQAALKARFDLNHDGQIDEKEWMLARAQARRETAKARTQQTQTFNDGINLLGATHDRARPYILSAYPQAQLLRRTQRAAALYAAGFFALGSLGLWLLHARFG